jgi:hypothetical protein
MSTLTTEDKMKCRLCKKEMEWRVTGLCSECEAKHPDIGGVVVGLTAELLPVIQKYDRKEGRYRRWAYKVFASFNTPIIGVVSEDEWDKVGVKILMA